MAAVDELMREWRGRNAEMLPGLDEAALADFEHRYSVSLPQDFRDFFRLANGTVPPGDDGLYCLWPLEDVKPVEEEYAGCEPEQLFPGCFVFADWAINAWLYAIQLQGDLGVVGRIFLVEGNGHRAAPIASSFGEWVALCSADSKLLVPGNARDEAVPQASAKRAPWWRFW